MRIAVTNNPMVRNKVPGHEVEFHDTDCMGVFRAVRDKVHLGHGLLTHPLAGSVKPGETPYKTVLVTGERGSLDESSLFIIEDSIQVCEKLKASVMKKEWSAEILNDFQLIDYSLIFG